MGDLRPQSWPLPHSQLIGEIISAAETKSLLKPQHFSLGPAELTGTATLILNRLEMLIFDRTQ